jgi:hypothetical protein
MATLFVARSTGLCKWAGDVGLGKHIYKVGCTDGDAKALVTGADWAGESDWKIVAKDAVEDLTDEEAVARLAKREKVVDPKYYPRLRGTPGVFRIDIAQVGNHLMVRRALAGDQGSTELKLKPADIGAYLIHAVLR